MHDIIISDFIYSCTIKKLIWLSLTACKIKAIIFTKKAGVAAYYKMCRPFRLFMIHS